MNGIWFRQAPVFCDLIDRPTNQNMWILSGTKYQPFFLKRSMPHRQYYLKKNVRYWPRYAKYVLCYVVRSRASTEPFESQPPAKVEN